MSLGYEKNYGMEHSPFVRNIPPDQVYLSPRSVEARSRLRYGIDHGAFVVMLADTGVGKTTLIRTVASGLPPGRYMLMYFSEAHLTPRRLYQGMLGEMGVEVRDFRKALPKLWRDTIPQYTNAEKRRAVCIIDDAHLVPDETLEELRFILNKDYDSDSYLSVVLAGTSELWDARLRLKYFEAIRQRVDILISLPRLDKAETGSYIQSQLHYAGGKQDLFTDRAVAAIFRLSHGVPRMVNRICDVVLSYGVQAGLSVIDDVTVKQVCKSEIWISEETD